MKRISAKVPPVDFSLIDVIVPGAAPNIVAGSDHMKVNVPSGELSQTTLNCCEFDKRKEVNESSVSC